MLFGRLDTRLSLAARLLGLALVTWSVLATSTDRAGTSGRGLVVTLLLAACVIGTLLWLRVRDVDAPLTPDTYALAAAGGALIGASPYTAASAFVFVAIVASGVRGGLQRGLQVAGIGALALAVTVIIWDEASVALVAYGLGFAAAGFAGANARQTRLRADEAELLLAQSQRSAEEQTRVARLEESTRIAREIHDVLAHALAGLTIQLEATTALIENGADSDQVLARVRRAHELAREGLRETRRAVGALRDGGEISVLEALGTLARAESARLSIRGDSARLRGQVGLAVIRVIQESLTNVAKHAPGSEVEITIDAGAVIVAEVESRLAGVPVGAGALSGSGGGYGIVGMRERAQSLGGTLSAGPTADGWRVTLRMPASGDPGVTR